MIAVCKLVVLYNFRGCHSNTIRQHKKEGWSTWTKIVNNLVIAVMLHFKEKKTQTSFVVFSFTTHNTQLEVFTRGVNGHVKEESLVIIQG